MCDDLLCAMRVLVSVRKVSDADSNQEKWDRKVIKGIVIKCCYCFDDAEFVSIQGSVINTELINGNLLIKKIFEE